MRRTSALSLMEILVVITVGSILMVTTLSQIGRSTDRRNLHRARQSFESMLSRARVMSVATGQLTRLLVDTSGDSIWIVRDGRTVDTVHMQDAFGVELRSTEATATICMGPRGHAEASCTSITSPMEVEFATDGHASRIVLLPLGQIYR